MKKIITTCMTAAFSFALAAPMAVAGEELKVENLPKNVQEAVKATVGKGKISEVEKGKEDGKVVYEIDYEANGKQYEMKVSADGKVLENKED